jgi:hypothetical protein
LWIVSSNATDTAEDFFENAETGLDLFCCAIDPWANAEHRSVLQLAPQSGFPHRLGYLGSQFGITIFAATSSYDLNTSH